MSADRQRLTSAIRRIAKTDPEPRGLLDAADNKGGKPGAAGVGSSTDAESQRICCDGSVSDNANPGTETREPVDGDQDGLDPDDPADLSGLDGGRLTGITDCATGEPICFEGDGFIPPDGWDDPSSPPTEYDYVDGAESLSEEEAGFLAAPNLESDEFNASSPEYGWRGTFDSTSYLGKTLAEVLIKMPRSITDDSGNNIFWSAGGLSETGYSRFGSQVIDGSPSGIGGFGSVQRYPCGSSELSGLEDCGQSYTVPTTESASSWPSDGCVNLAVKGGTIVGSKYDPENDGSYSAPRDSIDLCDPENGARITLRPSGQSDWKTIDAINGGDGYLYSEGKQIARVSGDEFTDPTV